MQSRVADTALTYSRAQEALAQDGLDAPNKAETSNENTRRTSSAKAEEKEAEEVTQGEKMTIKQLANQIEIWKRQVTDEKRRLEEMLILQNLTRKWCKRKIQLHKGALKWSKTKESHRKQRHKRKILGNAKKQNRQK